MALYIVYCKQDNAVVWSDTGPVHKAGRIPLGERLVVLSIESGWYKIERPEHISLPVQPNYPNYFIDPAVCQNTPVGGITPTPTPTPVPVPAGDVGAALAVIVNFVKALWKA